MIKDFLKRAWPHIAIVAIFAVVSIIYFSPILKGKVLPQGDNIQAVGSMHELVEYAKNEGEKSMWTNSMFSGMPAYQIMSDNSSNIYRTINHATQLGLPYGTTSILFLYLVGFYILLLTLKVDKLVAAIGALAFALGSYNIIIIVAGHITKAYAIAIMPLVVGGVMSVFRGNRIGGGILTMLALGMELAYNHLQITYYLGLMLMVLIVAELISAIKHKTLIDFGKNIGVLAAASVLAIAPCAVNIWTTFEYSKFSTRGESSLAQKSEGEVKANSGLDKEYALAWSYGKKETPTLLIPNAVGGASEPIGADNKHVQQIADPQMRQAVAGQSSYWGNRSFTSGPVYVGAIVCFLFFIGCFFCKGKEKWWLIAATIFSIFLAWGKNFMPFTDFMFYHFPMYNKFRTVEMALVIATVSIPMLGFLGLKEIIENPELVRYNLGKFFGALALSGGVALALAVAPTAFYSFLSDGEQEQFAQLIAGQNGAIYGELRDTLVETRASITQSDAVRSLVFILLASSALWFLSVRKINERIALATIAVLIGLDMWMVDRRYLSTDNFVSKTDARNSSFALTQADREILQDKEPHRVITLFRNPWNDAVTSYYHQSVGGYHGAKLHRYQDLIEDELDREWNAVRSALSAQDVEGIAKQLEYSNALNMLNTKYLIYNPNAAPLQNPNAFGAAWFVDKTIYAATPDEALRNVSTADLRTTAIVENEALSSTPDSTAQIVRTSYAPNKLTYKSKSAHDQLAVFSEIYYPKGWTATIDGKEANIEQANYVLRAIKVPAGEHTIEMRFEPQSYAKGRVIGYASSAIAVLLIIGGGVYSIKRRKDESAE